MDKYNESKLALEKALKEMSDEANSLYETMRLSDLKKANILDTVRESDYDDLTRLAAVVTGASTALITFLDEKRMWIKANYGVQLPIDNKREDSFCNVAIQTPQDVMIINDAHEDPRFKKNYWVVDQQLVRFYAGVPLLSTAERPVGSLCVIDNFARPLSKQQENDLRVVARIVTSLVSKRH